MIICRSNDTSIGQFLLLIAIHYHGNQLTTISEMVSNYLSIKVCSSRVSTNACVLVYIRLAFIHVCVALAERLLISIYCILNVM